MEHSADGNDSMFDFTGSGFINFTTVNPATDDMDDNTLKATLGTLLPIAAVSGIGGAVVGDCIVNTEKVIRASRGIVELEVKVRGPQASKVIFHQSRR